MSEVKRAELERLLARGRPPTFLLLHGPDEAGSARLARRALAALGGEVRELEPQALAAEPGLLADARASSSLFGGAEVLRVRGVGERQLAAVALALDADSGHAVVLEAGELKRGSALVRLVAHAPGAAVCVSWPMTPAEGAREAAALARAAGLDPAPGVAERLWADAGGDAGILEREIEKYALWLAARPGGRTPLAAEHCDRLGAAGLEAEAGPWLDALSRGDPAAAAEQLAMLEGEGSAIGLMRLAARRLLLVGRLADEVAKGRRPVDVVAGERPPVFWRDRAALAEGLARWDSESARQALGSLLRAEAAIKEPRSAGERLGWQALALAPAHAPAPARGAPARR